MSAKLFVGNLSFQATEEDLRELFAQAGNVETVRIITQEFRPPAIHRQFEDIYRSVAGAEGASA